MAPGTQTILIVDDEATIGAGLAAALECEGRTIVIAPDAESAELFLESQPVQLVMSDVKLSSPFRFEGLELIAIARQFSPTAPFAIMTGNLTPELEHEARIRGATIVLRKPFQLSAVDTLLSTPEAGTPAVITTIPTIDEVLKRDRLLPHFQPIVTPGSGDPSGFEALCRFQTETLFANPELLFRYAAMKGKTAQLELKCMEAALVAGAPLAQLGPLFLNTHPSLLADPASFSEGVLRAAAAGMVSPEAIVIEITEQASLPARDAVCAVVEELRHVGIRFAFDDVGSAYSHLRYIDDIRPDFLKISGVFGTAVESSTTRARIVANIQALARDFDARVVLEGVETELTDAFARKCGIDLAQGYFYHRPAPASAILERYTR